MEITKSARYRINISTSVKGVKTWEATVDLTGYEIADVLTRSDMLVEELERRYQIPQDSK